MRILLFSKIKRKRCCKWLCALFLSVCSASHGGPAETIAYIEGLLREDKVVAFLLIDLQSSAYPDFAPGSDEIITEQMRVIEHFTELTEEGDVFLRKGFRVVNTIFERDGMTIEQVSRTLRSSGIRDVYYKARGGPGQEPAFDAFVKDLRYVTPGDDAGAAAEMYVGLGDRLREWGVTHVIPTGCFDYLCVRRSARGARDAGFQVAVDRDMNIVASSSAERLIVRSLGLKDVQEYREITERKWRELFSDNVYAISTNPRSTRQSSRRCSIM